MHPATLPLNKIIFKFPGQNGVFILKLIWVAQLWTKQNMSNII